MLIITCWESSQTDINEYRNELRRSKRGEKSG